jgi:hypothetical protein
MFSKRYSGQGDCKTVGLFGKDWRGTGFISLMGIGFCIATQLMVDI